jgi:hypothetical protein
VDVKISVEYLRVTVHDDGDTLPTKTNAAADPAQTRGRGLLIVAGVAAQWGIDLDPTPPGKTVWADIQTGAGH